VTKHSTLGGTQQKAQFLMKQKNSDAWCCR
jgi:hypothetical protein